MSISYYRGYEIQETPDGYFRAADNDFTSYDEACDWIDEIWFDEAEESEESDDLTQYAAPEMHTYHIFYASRDAMCGYDEFIDAYNEDDAIAELRKMYPDVMYITDCIQID
jgi:hypothetical protein